MLIFLSFYIGLQASGVTSQDNFANISLCVLILANWYLNGTCINDLADEDIDKINLKNAPSRPLANELTSRKTLKIIATVSGILSLVLAYVISIDAAIVVLFALLLNWIYSMPPVRISYRGIWAPLLLPIGYILLPYLLAFYSSGASLDSFSASLVTCLYVCFVGRIVLKDIRDLEGDKKFGKRTFIVRYGLKNTILFSGFFFVIGSLGIIAIFIGRDSLLSTIIFLQIFAVLYCLKKMSNAVSRDIQQIVLGVISQIATTGLICIAIALNTNTNKHTENILLVSIALYGTVFGLYILNHPKYKRISY